VTPPEHLFIGFSFGNVVYAVQNFFRGRHLPYPVLLLLSGLTALLPDMDIFFNHYTSKDIFIGHRGITHSLLFVSAVSSVLVLAFMLFRRSCRTDQSGSGALYRAVFAVTLFPGVSHLVADLLPPPGHWGGIPVFFPLTSGGEFVRNGGWSLTGWFDYRIQWMYIAAFLVSLLFIIAFMLARRYNHGRLKMPLLITVLAVNMGLYLWTVDHVRHSEYVNRDQWLAVQNGYLENSGPLFRALTLRGQKYFLELFHKLR
jgi:membrane-bound metal-dependent hydrolase YbcI (DUF457 family)